MKDKSGNYFNANEDSQRPKEKRQSRRELENLRNQFMDRAKSFMDDTPLGEGRKMVEKFIGKVQDFVKEGDEEEGWEGEMLAEDAPETPFAGKPAADDDFDDDPYDEPDPEEELDWSRPEYIRAGYAKPGTKVERAKTLEEAQEESFSLKMGNLSGLLSRFGSEDASPESEQRQGTIHRMEMNKPLFREQMDLLYAELARQTGTDTDARLWLHPEVMTLLRAKNQPQRILLFAMAALFAATEENYLTEADQDWIRELMERAGFPLEPKIIQRVVEQTFIFPERVHRLYESLLAEPLEIIPQHFEMYRENLAKLYIYEVAARYGAEPSNVIRTLAAQWQQCAAALQQALLQAAPVQEQYARFQQRKMASATIFHKLRQAQENVLTQYEKLQAIAREVESLKQVTRLIEEEDALAKLEQFRSELVLPEAERIGTAAISLYDLRDKFVRAQIETLRSPETFLASVESVELSPVEQKHAISRAKEGEIKSLRLIESYKSWRVFEMNKSAAPPEADAETPAATSSASGPEPSSAADTEAVEPMPDQASEAQAEPAPVAEDAAVPAAPASEPVPEPAPTTVKARIAARPLGLKSTIGSAALAGSAKAELPPELDAAVTAAVTAGHEASPTQQPLPPSAPATPDQPAAASAPADPATAAGQAPPVIKRRTAPIYQPGPEPEVYAKIPEPGEP